MLKFIHRTLNVIDIYLQVNHIFSIEPLILLKIYIYVQMKRLAILEYFLKILYYTRVVVKNGYASWTSFNSRVTPCVINTHGWHSTRYAYCDLHRYHLSRLGETLHPYISFVSSFSILESLFSLWHKICNFS